MLAIPDEIKKTIQRKKVRRIVLFIITVLLMVAVIIIFEKTERFFSRILPHLSLCFIPCF